MSDTTPDQKQNAKAGKKQDAKLRIRSCAAGNGSACLGRFGRGNVGGNILIHDEIGHRLNLKRAVFGENGNNLHSRMRSTNPDQLFNRSFGSTDGNDNGGG